MTPVQCHPERTHYARGLCAVCYQDARRRADPERAKRYAKAYYAAHSERAKERSRRWYSANRERDKVRRKARKERTRAQDRIRQLKKYGMTPEAFAAKLSAQDGRCAICLTVLEKPVQDHDHATQTARGILCGSCNLMLGHASAGAAYLTTWGPATPALATQP